MSRIFYDKDQNRLIVLSYAGGTKFFTPLANELGYTTLHSVNNPGNPNYILQIVREPVQRFMSWFDKQYIAEIFRKKKINNNYFTSWCLKNIDKQLGMKSLLNVPFAQKDLLSLAMQKDRNHCMCNYSNFES